MWGSKDGALVRALTSHQCGPGSIPGPSVLCGLRFLLVLVPAPSVFAAFSGFLPSSKTNISNSNSIWCVSSISKPCRHNGKRANLLINLPFCRCVSLASSFVYYTTSDVWHVHPCRRDPASTSPLI